MDPDIKSKTSESSDEMSLKDFFQKIRSGSKYLKDRWLVLLTVALVGALIGLGYALLKKTRYTAVCTFVLEESSKGGGLSQYAGLASLAGIDIGGAGGNSMFQGDNILELYKSRSMIEKTLLSEVDFEGKKEQLIERYINGNNLRERWKSEGDLEKVSFKGPSEKFDRKQDSIIVDLVDLFNKKILTVSKPDKKLSIIYVNVIAKDELFAKEFTNKLVETVNEFYIQTKTKNIYQNVVVLQKQADSVKRELNSSIAGVANAIDAAPNANPAMIRLKVPSQKRQVDVQASTAVYGEIIKNLEISKISLRQETPLIQVIDKPLLPLINDKLSKLLAVVIGFAAGFVVSAFWLTAKAIIN